MKTKRIIAAVLAFLALTSFAGCKKEKKSPYTGHAAIRTNASENRDEAVSGQTDNYNDEQTENAKSVQQTKGKSSTPKDDAGASSTNSRYSRYFIGYRLYDDYSLDKWNHWDTVNEGFWDSNGNYYQNTVSKYNSHGDIVKYTAYDIFSQDNNEATAINYNYVYNNDGTVKEFTDSSKQGLRYCYKYDTNKRPARISAVDEGNGDETYVLNLSYDKNGRLAYADDGNCRATFTYDKNGNLIKKERSYSAGDLAIQTYKYNSRNDVVEATHNILLSSYTYEYDKNGFLIKIIEKGSDYMCETEYKNDKYGNPIEEKHTTKENGKVTSTYTYTYSYTYNASSIVVIGKETNRTTYTEYEYHANRKLRDLTSYTG